MLLCEKCGKNYATETMMREMGLRPLRICSECKNKMTGQNQFGIKSNTKEK